MFRIGFPGRVFFIISTLTDTILILENFGGFSGIIFTSDYYAFKCDQIQGQVCPCCSNNAHNKNNYHTSIINTRRPGCWYYHILFFFAPFVGKKTYDENEKPSAYHHTRTCFLFENTLKPRYIYVVCVVYKVVLNKSRDAFESGVLASFALAFASLLGKGSMRGSTGRAAFAGVETVDHHHHHHHHHHFRRRRRRRRFSRGRERRSR